MRELREHVTEYYKKLFGHEEVADIHLAGDMWLADKQVSAEDN